MMLFIYYSNLRLMPWRIHWWRVIVARGLNDFFMMDIMIISLLVMAESYNQCKYKAKYNAKNNNSNYRSNC